jgi:hypothetical protein
MMNLRQAMLVGALFVGVLSGQAPDVHLRSIGAVAGEHGLVAVRGNTVSMFSDGNIRTRDGAQSNWKLQAHVESGILAEVSDGGIKIRESELGLDSAFAPAACDPLNQIDLRSTQPELASALPAKAKIKKLLRINPDTTLVVFSPSSARSRYQVDVAVMRQSSTGSIRKVSETVVSTSGNFCGVLHLEKGTYVIFADEPSASSDFLAAYIYDVK